MNKVRLCLLTILSLISVESHSVVVWEVKSHFFNAVFKTEGWFESSPAGVNHYTGNEILSFYVNESSNYGSDYMPLGDWADPSGTLSFAFGDALGSGELSYVNAADPEPFPVIFSFSVFKDAFLFTNSAGEDVYYNAHYQLYRDFGSKTSYVWGPNLESCANDLMEYDAQGIERDYTTACNLFVGGSYLDIAYLGEVDDWRTQEVDEPPMLGVLFGGLLVLIATRIRNKIKTTG